MILFWHPEVIQTEIVRYQTLINYLQNILAINIILYFYAPDMFLLCIISLLKEEMVKQDFHSYLFKNRINEISAGQGIFYASLTTSVVKKPEKVKGKNRLHKVILWPHHPHNRMNGHTYVCMNAYMLSETACSSPRHRYPH